MEKYHVTVSATSTLHRSGSARWNSIYGSVIIHYLSCNIHIPLLPLPTMSILQRRIPSLGGDPQLATWQHLFRHTDRVIAAHPCRVRAHYNPFVHASALLVVSKAQRTEAAAWVIHSGSTWTSADSVLQSVHRCSPRRREAARDTVHHPDHPQLQAQSRTNPTFSINLLLPPECKAA